MAATQMVLAITTCTVEEPKQALTIAYGADRNLCVCGVRTWATCRDCGETCCGNCLGSERHARAYHAALA